MGFDSKLSLDPSRFSLLLVGTRHLSAEYSISAFTFYCTRIVILRKDPQGKIKNQPHSPDEYRGHHSYCEYYWLEIPTVADRGFLPVN